MNCWNSSHFYRRLAIILVVVGPLSLLAGALFFQYGLNLPVCKLCVWQRWFHIGTVLLGFTAIRFEKNWILLIRLACMSLLVGAGVGFYQVGLEQHWWTSGLQCVGVISYPDMEKFVSSLLQVPVARCDVAPWAFLDISLAGWNVIFSLAIMGVALWTTRRN